jgi:hypothetical protein
MLALLASLWLGPPGRPPGTGPASTGPASTGAVTGYIRPCSGLGIPQYTKTGARLFSAAATVEALRGREYQKPAGHGNYQMVMPTTVAARERVGPNQEFRLDRLPPGRYVILAQYTRGGAITFRDLSVSAGRIADLTLPNTCM